MSAVIPFQYDGAPVRVVEIDGEPWFVAADVARVLGYANGRDAVSQHCKSAQVLDLNTVVKRDGIRGNPNATVIPERDLYRLIMRSKLPAAEKFEEWVVGEVLPRIRKTGSYTVDMPRSFPEALRAYADAIEQQERDRPKVEFYDAVAGSKDAIEMKHAAKVLNIGVGRNKLFEFLRAEGVLMQDNTPYQEYVDRGYFRLVEQKYTRADGETHVNFKTLVYQRGLEFIRKLYRKKKAAA